MSWAMCTEGHRHWGPRGAAGLLLARDGRALLQLRAHWAHQGGTWSIPGGAIERREAGLDAACREAQEELGLDPASYRVDGSSMAECGGWTYETVLAVPVAHVAVRNLAESDGHDWVAADAVEDLPLHPSFRTAWSADGSRLRAFVESTVTR